MEALFTLDVHGRVAGWNDSAARFTGYRSDEALGRALATFYDHEPAAPAELPSPEQPDRHERTLLRHDGARLRVWATVAALRDERGRATGFAVLLRDSSTPPPGTDQSQERMRLMLESVRDYAIFMLDPGGHVTSWNAAAERIKGYTADEIIGQHFSRFYLEDQVLSGKCESELETAAREGRFEDDDWRVRKDGSRFWANVVITALRDDTGRLLGFCKVTRDLTERRRAEQGRLRLAQAEEAVRLRDEFLSIASHELRTPLTALQLQLEALHALPSLDPKLKQRLSRATRSGERLAALITTLLDVSRIATREIVLQRTSFDLRDAVEEVVLDLSEAARNARSSFTVSGERGLVGNWDRIRIQQAVTNVLSNALKYGAGSPVELKLAREGGTALLEVSDRGPGVDEADQERIFGRFERAAPLRNYGGLGLGLYVTREILDAHGGTIGTRNLQGGGACFSIRVPLGGARSGASEDES